MYFGPKREWEGGAGPARYRTSMEVGESLSRRKVEETQPSKLGKARGLQDDLVFKLASRKKRGAKKNWRHRDDPHASERSPGA